MLLMLSYRRYKTKFGIPRRLFGRATGTCLHPRVHSSSTMADDCVIQMNPYTYFQQNTSRKTLKASTCMGPPVLSSLRPIQTPDEEKSTSTNPAWSALPPQRDILLGDDIGPASCFSIEGHHPSFSL